MNLFTLLKKTLLVSIIAILCIQTKASPPDTIWSRKVQPMGNSCNSVSFSKDGTRLLAATDCHNAYARLFNTVDGSINWTYTDSSLMCFMDVKFSPNGERFAIMEEFGVLLVFDYTTPIPTKIAQIDTRSNGSLALAFTPNNEQVITSGFDDTIRVFSLQSQQEILKLGRHNNIYSISVNSDGSQIVSGSQDGTVKIWNLQNGELVRTLNGHTSPVRNVIFSEDGQKLITTSQDGRLSIWNTQTGLRDTTIFAHSGSSNGLSISPDGKWFATAGADGIVKLWNWGVWSLMESFKNASLGALNGLSISPDGKKIAVASALGFAAMFDISGVSTFVSEINAPSLELSLFPNPVEHQLAIKFAESFDGTLDVTDQLGKPIAEFNIKDQSTFSLEASSLSQGIYFLYFTDSKTKTSTCRKFNKL